MKKCRYALMLLIMAVSSVGLVAIFQGCSSNYAKVSNLVCIKVNNFMANFTNEEYNFTKEGSNAMYVTVPYTNTLKITDLILSPESSATIYEDAEHTIKVEDKNKIAISNISTLPIEKRLYIVVQNDKKKKQKTEYEVSVRISAPKGISENQLKDVPIDNPDGHIWIPENATKITINNEEFVVVRTADDILSLITIEKIDLLEIKTLNTSIIFANDIVKEDHSLSDIKLLKGVTIDGNNYNFKVFYDMSRTGGKSPIFFIKWNNGIIRNILLPESEDKNKNIRLCYSNAGKIENCVNYNSSNENDTLNSRFFACDLSPAVERERCRDLTTPTPCGCL